MRFGVVIRVYGFMAYPNINTNTTLTQHTKADFDFYDSPEALEAVIVEVMNGLS